MAIAIHRTTNSFLRERKQVKRASANFAPLGFSAGESVGLKMHAALHSSIVEVIKRRDYSQAQLTQILDTDQARISNLMRAKIANFNLKTFVQCAERLGMKAQMKIDPHLLKMTGR